MAAFFIYLKLELKRACKILPYFMTGAIVLALLLGTIAFLSSKVLYGETAVGRVGVGVVLPEEDAVAKKAVSMLESMDSVKSICDFQYVEEENGRELLQQGELHALLLVPADFVQGIISGENEPVKVLLRNGDGLETMVFRALTDGGAKTLGAAQAAIYAADQLFIELGLPEGIPQAEKVLNQLFLEYALPRETYFKFRQVSAVGDFTTLEFYGATCFVLFLLLCGIPASSLLRPESRVWKQKLNMLRIGDGKVVCVRICTVTCLLITASALAVSLLASFEILTFRWHWMILIPLVCTAAAAWIVAAFEVSGSMMAGVMVLFLGAVAMVFISGGLIPSVFLPEGVNALAPWVPVSSMIKGISMAVTGEMIPTEFGKLLIWILAAFLLAVAGRRSHG